MHVLPWSRVTTLLLATALTAAISGCRDERDPVPPPSRETYGREYFPLAIGRFWEYDVVEHHWNFNTDSIVRFQFRERIDTLYRGAAGDTIYHLVRARRADSLSVWREDSARDLIRTADLVRRTASNVPTIELLFPVWEGKGWNPNLYNSRDSTERRYEQVGIPWTLPAGRRFVQTVRVVDSPQISAVLDHQHEAAYAWNIGCIYRHSRALEYCNTSEVGQGLCQLGTGYIVRGIEREEQLHAWGPR